MLYECLSYKLELQIIEKDVCTMYLDMRCLANEI